MVGHFYDNKPEPNTTLSLIEPAPPGLTISGNLTGEIEHLNTGDKKGIIKGTIISCDLCTVSNEQVYLGDEKNIQLYFYFKNNAGTSIVGRSINWSNGTNPRMGGYRAPMKVRKR